MAMPDDVLDPMFRTAPAGLLNDRSIMLRCSRDKMIEPYEGKLIREVDGRKVISYGLSSYGYDLRLSHKDFRVFRHRPGRLVNPKAFEPDFLEQSELIMDDQFGDYFILPGNSYALGSTVERVKMPQNVTAVCVGKSTYARCGIIANVTPIEAGWEGFITLEFSNSSSSDAMVFVGEGAVQLLFFEGKQCMESYSDRQGKYQNQSDGVTLARV
jgi:dCTP deaminase